MSVLFKNLKLHEPLQGVQFEIFEKLLLIINPKLNKKNRMITY